MAGPRRRSEARDDSDLETTFPKRLRPRGKETIGIWWRGKRRIFTAKRIEKSRLEYNGAEIGLIARSRSGFLRGTRVKTRKSRAKVVSRGRGGERGGRLGDFWLGVMARSMGRGGGRSNGERVKNLLR